MNSVPDSEIRERMLALMEAEGEGLFDESDVAITADPLDFFDEAAAQECWSYRRRTSRIIDGLSFVAFEGVQMFKGQPRRDLKIVDFGEKRAVIGGSK